MAHRKLGRLLNVTLLTTVVAVVAPRDASAATLCVDNSPGCSDTLATPLTSCAPGPAYCTIQAAETASSPGDTIMVAAGVGPYAGVFIAKSNQTLKCAKAGIDARTRTTAGETVISEGLPTTVAPATTLESGPTRASAAPTAATRSSTTSSRTTSSGSIQTAPASTRP